MKSKLTPFSSLIKTRFFCSAHHSLVIVKQNDAPLKRLAILSDVIMRILSIMKTKMSHYKSKMNCTIDFIYRFTFTAGV